MELRLLRHVLGLSQRELGTILELDHRRVSEIELGQRQPREKDNHVLATLVREHGNSLRDAETLVATMRTSSVSGRQRERAR